jgi:hypothetical protein
VATGTTQRAGVAGVASCTESPPWAQERCGAGAARVKVVSSPRLERAGRGLVHDMARPSTKGIWAADSLKSGTCWFAVHGAHGVAFGLQAGCWLRARVGPERAATWVQGAGGAAVTQQHRALLRAHQLPGSRRRRRRGSWRLVDWLVGEHVVHSVGRRSKSQPGVWPVWSVEITAWGGTGPSRPALLGPVPPGDTEGTGKLTWRDAMQGEAGPRTHKAPPGQHLNTGHRVTRVHEHVRPNILRTVQQRRLGGSRGVEAGASARSLPT